MDKQSLNLRYSKSESDEEHELSNGTFKLTGTTENGSKSSVPASVILEELKQEDKANIGESNNIMAKK